MKQIQIIPSKSDAHRALICAALSKTDCRVLCKQTSKDIDATKKCLAALEKGQQDLYCGESGSTFRFLLPVAAALGKKAAFYPEGRLPQRPLSPLYEELQRHGCKLSPQGTVPFVIEGQLEPGDYQIAGNVSSQYISGLLFALPLLDGESHIHIEGPLESAPYVDMTVATLERFGITIEKTESGYHIPGGQTYLGPNTYQVEGDWSNGCFWLAMGAFLEEGIQVTGLNPDSVQGDRKMIELLKEMGARVTVSADAIAVEKSELHGIEIDVSQIPDMVPILAVLALAAEGTTEIKGARRLRMKESDRLATVTGALTALGGQVEELEDGLRIQGGKILTGGTVNTHNDHRIAMMAAAASLICDGKVIIENAKAVEKSYPDFFTRLEESGLAGKVERK